MLVQHFTRKMTYVCFVYNRNMFYYSDRFQFNVVPFVQNSVCQASEADCFMITTEENCVRHPIQTNYAFDIYSQYKSGLFL